jgi:hypothetical protein
VGLGGRRIGGHTRAAYLLPPEASALDLRTSIGYIDHQADTPASPPAKNVAHALGSEGAHRQAPCSSMRAERAGQGKGQGHALCIHGYGRVNNGVGRVLRPLGCERVVHPEVHGERRALPQRGDAPRCVQAAHAVRPEDARASCERALAAGRRALAYGGAQVCELTEGLARGGRKWPLNEDKSQTFAVNVQPSVRATIV